VRAVVSSALLAAAISFGMAPPAQALSYQMMADQDLLQQAGGVAVFDVIKVAPPRPGDTETRYLLGWRRGISGPMGSGFEWLALPGADASDDWLHVEGIPKLEPGQQWLLFYQRRADGVLQPTQLTLGMFLRRDDGHDASYWRTVDVDREGMLKSVNDAYARGRDADAFERWLREADAGVEAPHDYLLEADDPRLMAKYTFAMFGFTPARPARWFEFDNGGSVPVRAAAGGQANTASDEFAALNQAIGAWNNDTGSRVNLAYAGTGSSSADSAINVTWNDPNSQIAGSFNCSSGGVLGIGGSTATTSQSTTLGGQNWAKRIRGFVVIQDGAGCAMDRNNGSSGAELLAHELGHVLAMGHSCGDDSSGSCNTTAKNEAIMRASLHGDGRGATLGSDDRAGIAVPYPQPAGSTPSKPPLVYRNSFEP